MTSARFQFSFPEDWSEFCTELGVVSGILTGESSDGSLEEQASFGYPEDGFFYQFLSRKGEYFQKLQKGQSLVLSSKQVQLFQGNHVLVIPRISENSLRGFFLFETQEAPSRAIEILCSVLDSGVKIRSKLEPRDLPPFPEGGESEYFLLLPGVKDRWEFLKHLSPIFVLGMPGSGKKEFIKSIHREASPSQPFLWIREIPDSLPKLERAFSNWIEEARGGTLVLSGFSKWKHHQQRFFFQAQEELAHNKIRVCYLDRFLEKSESYINFYESSLEHSITLPSLDSLPKDILRKAILIFWDSVCREKQKEGCQLGQEVIEKLLEKSYPENFRTLKGMLEKALRNRSGSEIQWEDLNKSSEDFFVAPHPEDLDLRKSVEALEKEKILLAEKLFLGNQVQMSKALGISRGSLQYKKKQLGLE
jgi:hypothetical protein